MSNDRLKRAVEQVLREMPAYAGRCIEAGAAHVGFPDLAPESRWEAFKEMKGDPMHLLAAELRAAVNETLTEPAPPDPADLN